jgi:flagellar motor switch protein FliG
MMNIKNPILCFMLLLMTAISTAEVITYQDEIKEIEIENELASRLQTAIESYLGHNKFVVSVDMVLKFEAITPNNDALLDYQARQIKASSEIAKLVRRHNTFLKNSQSISLPGLAQGQNVQIDLLDQDAEQVILDQIDTNKKILAEAAPAIELKGLGITSKVALIKVTLQIDDKVSEIHKTHIKSMITEITGLDIFRGDTLKVIAIPFAEKPTEVVATSETEAISGDKVVGFSELETFFKHNWLIIALAILFIILLLWFINRKKPLPADTPQPPVNTSWNDIVSMESEAQKFKADVLASKRHELATLKQDIISQLMGQPEKGKQLLDNLNNDQQLSTMAGMLHVLGYSMFQTLLPSIRKNDLQQYQDYLGDNELTQEQQLESLNTVKQALENTDTTAINSARPFDFLHKLTDSQVLYLLKDEPARIRALVLSQIEANRASVLLNRHAPQAKAVIAMELSHFDQLPVNTFRSVADRLARASLDMPSFEHMNAKGPDVLINMLDAMPLAEETEILAQIREQDPESYYRIRENYFTFDDITRIAAEPLADILRLFNRTELAKALVSTDDKLQQYVMAAIPDKLRNAVINEFEHLDQVEAKEVSDAQSKLVIHIREQIKAGRISMNDLETLA